MLVRYTKDDTGKTVRQAEIYTSDEHSITLSDIDTDAVKIVRRLHTSGHHAYIVGGAVRDLLIGKHPKDFDIATDAQPGRIRRLFRNSRAIGRRFRLVHIFFKDKVIEVSTFRSENSAGFQNEYGEIVEDVFRRDFTVNALYYSPSDGRIIDYVGGVADIRDRTLKPLIPLDRIFEEDPVRMIRAVKYAATTGFKMTGKLRRQIKRSVSLLAVTPPSRMTEEVFKILLCGNSETAVRECLSFGLLIHMVPNVAVLAERNTTYRDALLTRLAYLDGEVNVANEGRRSRAAAYLCADYLFRETPQGKAPRIPFSESFEVLKTFLRPLVPANREIEGALIFLIRHRKHYLRSGSLEATPPEERPRSEPIVREDAPANEPQKKADGRRRGSTRRRRTS